MTYSRITFLWFATPLLRKFVAALFFLHCLGINFVLAQVITNISPDSTLPTNSVIAPNGNVFDITAGTKMGSNLFHSFQEFNVGQGDAANFVDPGGIANILSRVTGSNVSNIFGQLRSDSSVNLFFLNPNGVIFGPNSSLDVGGSFHVSTADFVRFEDGNIFYSDAALDGSADSLLRAAPPAAFGFLGNPVSFGFSTKTPAPITIASLVDRSGGKEFLEVNGGETFSLVGGDISIIGDGPPGIQNGVYARGGTFNIASMRSVGEVPVNLQNFAIDGSRSLGAISISNIQLSTGGGGQLGSGKMVIRGGKVALDGSDISTGTFDLEGKQVSNINSDIRALDKVAISAIGMEVTGSGSIVGNTINVQAESILIEGRDRFNNNSIVEGEAEVTLSARDLILTNGGQLSTSTVNSFSGSDNAGPISIIATGAVTISGPESGIFSSSDGSGNGGSIQLEVGSLTLTDGAAIDSGTTLTSSGKAGSITVNASDSITLSSNGLLESRIVSQSKGSGISGSISITTPLMEVATGGRISATTIVDPGAIAGTNGQVDLNVADLALTGGFIDGFSPSVIAMDGSLGAGEILIGPDFIIGSDLGQVRGENLFHSFSRFVLQAGETATFMGSPTIARILSRVTGDDTTILNGRLRSTIPGADLFFLAPNGVFIGPSARLDISGSFHLSTAHSLRLNDGTIWRSIQVNGSELSDGIPVAFGFDNSSIFDISVIQNRLFVLEGKTLSFIGGDLGISSDLRAPLGQIELISLASSGEVLTAPVVDSLIFRADGFQELGKTETVLANLESGNGNFIGEEVALNESEVLFDRLNITGTDISIVDTRLSGESINIAGTEIALESGFLSVDNVNILGVDLPSTGQKSKILVRDGQEIQTSSGEGLIDLEASIIEVDQSIVSVSNFAVDFGEIIGSITGKEMVTFSNSNLSNGNGFGSIGDIVIETPVLEITNNTLFTGGTTSGFSTGAFVLNVSSLEMQNSTIELTGGTSSPGSVFIRGVGGEGTDASSVILENSIIDVKDFFGGEFLPLGEGQVSIFSDLVRLSDSHIFNFGESGGNGGRTELNVGTLELIQDSSIDSFEGGSIDISARDSISINDSSLNANVFDEIEGLDEAADITLSTPIFTITNGSLTASSGGSRDAGNVTILTDRFESNPNPETAGRVLISSSSSDIGNAGNIVIAGQDGPGTPVANAIMLADTDLTTAAFDTGEGGAIVINGNSSVTFTDTTLSADVTNGTDASEEATGSITLTAPALTIMGGGVTGLSTGMRKAGDLTFNVDQLTTQAGTTPLPEGDADATTRVQINSSSTASGNAGNIVIAGEDGSNTPVANAIMLADTDLATAAFDTGEGGAIVIHGNSAITFTDTTLSADVTNGTDASEEATGSITLTAPALTIMGGGVTAESTGTRAAGDLTFKVDQLTTQAGTTPLPEGDADATTRVQISSSSAADGRAGNVVIQGESPGQLATAGPIMLTDTDITTEAKGTGEGGAIVMASDSAITLTDSTLSADVNNGTDPTEEATGSITLTAPALTIAGGGVTAESTGTRAAGDLTFNVDQLMTLAGTTPLPEGDTDATTRVQISSSSAADGRAGNVVIQGESPGQLATAGPIMLTDTDITTEALGTGVGGDISVLSFDMIALDHTTLSANVTNLGPNESANSGSDIAIVTPVLSIVGGGITAESTGSRIAGNIGLSTDSLLTQEGLTTTMVGEESRTRVLLSSSSTGENTQGNQDGKAGNVVISGPLDPFVDFLVPVAGTVTLEDTDIQTESRGNGPGGDISITALDTVTLDHSTLSADVNNGTGSAVGDIVLIAPELSMVGGGITAQSTGSQSAGSISLGITGSLTTQEGSRLVTVDNQPRTRALISSSSQGTDTQGLEDGKAGNLLILVEGQANIADTDLRTEARRNGQGGSIQFVSQDKTTLDHSTVSVDVNNTLNDPANEALIRVITPELEITGGGLTGRTSGSRNAGNVLLQVDSLTTLQGSKLVVINNQETPRVQLSSSSSSTATIQGLQDGDAGTVFITSSSTTANSIVPIPGPVIFEATDIQTESLGNGKGGSIDIASNSPIIFTDTTLSANVTSGTDAPGTSTGSITLSTPALTIAGGGVTAVSNGTRNAGDITLNVGQLTTQAGTIPLPEGEANATTRVQISSSGTDTGNAGRIVIQGEGGDNTTVANAVTFVDTDVSTEAQRSGIAGSIDIAAPTSVALSNSTISATAKGSGDAGNITFTETDRFTSTNSQITTEANTGAGGSITIPSTSPMVLTDTTISATGTGNAPADKKGGSIEVRATALSLDDGTIEAETAGAGPGGSIDIIAPISVALNGTSISATANGNGDAGSITFAETGSFSARGSRIETVANTGAGGTITIPSTSTMFFRDTALSATSLNNTVEKSGGSIALTATDLTVGGGAIQAETTGQGPGGSIDITASTSVTLTSTKVSATASGSGDAGNITFTETGSFQSTNSQITTEANTGAGGSISLSGLSNLLLDSTTISATVSPDDPSEGGQGGNITILGGQINPRDPNFGNEQLLVRNGSTITAESRGRGDAGTITLETAGTLRFSDSSITTTATEASGGRIKLDADFMVHILSSRLVSSVQGNDQDTSGGDINIDPEFIILQDSQILAQAEAGTGGNIDLIGDVVLIDALSTLNADSRLGVSGTVNISSPIQNLSGAIAPLPETIIQTATLYAAQCAAQKEGAFSSLSIRGRDRIPYEPGDYLLTPLLLNQGDTNLSRVLPSLSSPMSTRLGISAVTAKGLEVFTSFEKGNISLDFFEGGCQS